MIQYIQFQRPIFERKWELSDSNKRTLLKTITWRITGSASTFTIAYMLTGSVGLSSGIAIVQMIVNTFLYWFHEKLWNKNDWQRK
jgi:uncharacterized membrane protein